MRDKLTFFLLLIISFGVLFYRLGEAPLHPWDEAWFGSIAKNIVKTGNWIELEYNGQKFWDHPPLGFWAIAFSYLVGGVSELTTRLPMAFFASLAVAVMFLTGKKLGNYQTGLAAALILFSCRWFLLRARTGNLDSLLVLTQICFFYFAVGLKRLRELYLMWFIFALILLTKSVIGFLLLPLGIVSAFDYYQREGLTRKVIIRVGLVIFFPLSIWFGFNTIKYGTAFWYRHLIQIGLRYGSTSGVGWESVQRTLLYLRSAIHKWYWPFVSGIGLSFFWRKQKSIRWVWGYLILVSFPFFISSQTEIWHLLPVMAPMALLIPLSWQRLFDIPVRLLKLPRKLSSYLVTMMMLTIALISWRTYFQEIYETGLLRDAGQVVLAKKANEISAELYLQTFMDFKPTVIFYSDRYVTAMYAGEEREFREKIDELRPFQLIADKDYLKKLDNYSITGESGNERLAYFGDLSDYLNDHD